MPYIFISYSHQDEEYAKLIQNALEECNLEVFIAGTNIDPSEDWEDTIWTELEALHGFFIGIERAFFEFALSSAVYK